MNSSRPYLIRALHEWIVDNQCTPYLLISSCFPGTVVPDGFAQDGQIVLNASPSAVRYLHMDNESISFEARFSGSPFQLYIPMAAVLAIYAKENGQGMFFELEEETFSNGQAAELEEDATPSLTIASTEQQKEKSDDDDPEPPKPTIKGRAHLKVVK